MEQVASKVCRKIGGKKMQKKRIQKNGFLIVVGLLLVEFLLYFLLTNKWLLLAVIIALDIFLLVVIRLLIRDVEITNVEKIQEASSIAEQSLDYVVNEVPVGIITYNGETRAVEWLNPYAASIFNKDNQLTLTASQVTSYLELAERNQDIFTIDENTYRFSVNKEQHTITFEDITKESNLYQEKVEMQTAIGIVSVDNYDDVTDTMDEKEISYLNSFITTMVSDWMDQYKVFYKRINAERYFFIAQWEDIQKMMDEKFSILDTIRKESANHEVAITLSMGIAYGGATLDQTGTTAQTNLDTALVRGGDQVVVKEAKDEAKPLFFGGKTAVTTKRSQVRSRAMSMAIKGIIAESADIYIMGHRYPDMDALGSAFGVARLASFNNRKAWIVLDENEIIPDVKRVLEAIKEYPELEECIISPKEAMKRKKESSLLVMVDYHKPSLSISKELYERFDKVVIIDHHRRGDEFPAKPLLSYIESSASSASELVTELIEYQSNSANKLQAFEATMMLAGIVVDTKSFNTRTTARTFDVASYLRTCGADSSLVQYLLSSDLTSYLEMNNLISKSEYVTKDTVVVAGSEDKEYDSVTAAKTADTLLSMAGINAAFVITKRTDQQIGISARSNGSINVQIIMENLGGGGHFTNAAVQLSNVTVAEVKEQLLDVIRQNINEMYEQE
ncbi:DHH family phosphoesterase [Enterococcus faecalis]|uniref:DHH family phosphoesterase n=1 Tax=Enterococcus TaxID=1350 RepID=UPI0013B062BD|nr:DHH family phosphoesterase [Enterococcus faecalis]EGO8275482.1 DHH family phosphoesterase [Enterococcus faecalis]MBM9831948.1 DHH family phosphoesterase [Enterococcus faecalis]MBP4092453.1 DHH family phosphoesterase [Enterococcus faecalis]MBP4103898.1 DHH family phosphoesterase [Enterococcus faecalis]MDB1624179.1 DHH family phosphoesterase [Enterococcus faecalis]